jgi:hypothetical protein
MELYHFTAHRFLRGIAKHGLTVGDVPTDIRRGAGRVGVWFTTVKGADGHGLGGALDKKALRLRVDIPENSPQLVRWPEWSKSNVTEETIAALHDAGGRGFDTWYIFFGIVEPDAIGECFDMDNNRAVDNWRDTPALPNDIPGVPAWRRDAWHKNLLKKVGRALRNRQA